MPKSASPPEIAWLLDLIDQAYERKAWHGPNLRGSVRGLTPEVAAWRPDPERHSIAEQVLHAAYWKYSARRRLRGDKRGSFPLKGSNWFPVPEPLSAADWQAFVNELDTQHRQFRETVVEFSARRLDESPGQSPYTFRALITGLAAHDIYHAGQIQLLKRLQRLS
jgi:hypothetical protein